MRQLVGSWIEAQKNGYRKTLSEAIKELNKDSGSTVALSRFAEWGKGKYTRSAKVLSHLLFWVLPWALLRAGLETTEAQRDALEDLIWNVRGGGRPPAHRLLPVSAVQSGKRHRPAIGRTHSLWRC
jgi:hypothetical protein